MRVPKHHANRALLRMLLCQGSCLVKPSRNWHICLHVQFTFIVPLLNPTLRGCGLVTKVWKRDKRKEEKSRRILSDPLPLKISLSFHFTSERNDIYKTGKQLANANFQFLDEFVIAIRKACCLVRFCVLYCWNLLDRSDDLYYRSLVFVKGTFSAPSAHLQRTSVRWTFLPFGK